MKLSELIRVGPDVALTVATIATLGGWIGPSVARVASVKVANPARDHIQEAVAKHLSAVTTGAHIVAGCLDATDFRYLYHERAGIYEFDGDQERARAEARAWNQVATIWYRQHGKPVSDDLCAGCGQPLIGVPYLNLVPRGDERAHANGADCRRRYFARWRREAANALEAIGIPTPCGPVDEPEKMGPANK